VGEYLVCYDYGQGGVWLYLPAENRAELTKRYPALTVFDEPPRWWTPEMEAVTRKQNADDPLWRDWLAKLPQ
jgi:hypothetical protein